MTEKLKFIEVQCIYCHRPYIIPENKTDVDFYCSDDCRFFDKNPELAEFNRELFDASEYYYDNKDKINF